MKNNRKLRAAVLVVSLGLATSLALPTTANAGAPGFAIMCTYNSSTGVISASALSSPGGTASVAYQIFFDTGTYYYDTAFGYGKPYFPTTYYFIPSQNLVRIRAFPLNKLGNRTSHLQNFSDDIFCAVTI